MLARPAIAVAVLLLALGPGYDWLAPGDGTPGGTPKISSPGMPRPPDAVKRGVVERVIDGDTIELAGPGSTRLIGVDTPEVYGGVECYGREASSYVGRVAPAGTRVLYEVGIEPRDRYDRLLAYIWLDEGERFLNGMLVEGGYAMPLTIPPNVDHADLFVELAREARREGVGLWDRRACKPEDRSQ